MRGGFDPFHRGRYTERAADGEHCLEQGLVRIAADILQERFVDFHAVEGKAA